MPTPVGVLENSWSHNRRESELSRGNYLGSRSICQSVLNLPVHQSCFLEERKNLLINLDPWKPLGFPVSVEVGFRSCLAISLPDFSQCGSATWKASWAFSCCPAWWCLNEWLVQVPSADQRQPITGVYSADDHWGWLQCLVLSNFSELWRRF